MKQVYAPGCALMIYKPKLAKKVLEFLKKSIGNIPKHLICCRHEPNLKSGTQVINTRCLSYAHRGKGTLGN